MCLGAVSNPSCNITWVCRVTPVLNEAITIQTQPFPHLVPTRLATIIALYTQRRKNSRKLVYWQGFFPRKDNLHILFTFLENKVLNTDKTETSWSQNLQARARFLGLLSRGRFVNTNASTKLIRALRHLAIVLTVIWRLPQPACPRLKNHRDDEELRVRHNSGLSPHPAHLPFIT